MITTSREAKREICLMGGLGNQLFQFAFGRVISGYGQFDLKFDISHDSLRRRRDGMPELVDVLNGNETEMVNRQWSFISSRMRNIAIRLTTDQNAFKWLIRETVKSSLEVLLNNQAALTKNKNKVFLSRGLGETFVPRNTSKVDLYCIGYFQTKTYFCEVVRNDPETLNLWKNFVASHSRRWTEFKPESSLLMHIRRGDYIDSSFGILSLEYYKQAISMALEANKVENIYLISDEANGNLKDEFSSVAKSIKIIDTKKLQASQILGLMSQFKVLIGANSSLSWWGAALGGLNRSNSVFFPARWFRGEPSPGNLIFSEWTCINGNVWK